MITERLKQHRGILAILLAFLILGGVYGTITPIFEKADEIQHYFHVKYIADRKGLPVLAPQSEELYAQEGGQPSLYYLLGAAVSFWINTDDAEELLDYNPFVNLGVPSRDGNKNIVLHTLQEGFPYRGATLAVRLLRCVSVLFGAVTVLVTYWLALETFAGRKAVALGAAAITAFNPQFIFTTSAVNNDGLLTALCTLALLLCVLLIGRGPSVRRYVGLGVVVGLAALTKLTGLGLLVLVFVSLIVVARRCSLRESIRGGAIVLGLVVLLAGWWYVRNWALYGDPTAMNMFFNALGGTPGREFTLSTLVRELEGFKLSYWAVFGWFNVLASTWVYRFFDLVTLLGILGLPLAVLRGLKRRSSVSFASLLLIVLWIGVVAAGYVRYNQLIDAATGRLVFPAIACFSILLSWGLVQLPPREHRRLFVGILGTMLALVAAVCPFLYIAPAYARPPLLSDQELESIPHRVEVDYEGQMRLLGYALEGDVFRPGELVHVTLYWEALTKMARDYSVSLTVLTPSGDLIGQEDSYPGLGSFPTRVWEPGDTVADRTWVRIRRRADVPTIGWLGVSVYDLPTMRHLTPSREGQPLEYVFLQPVKIVPWQPEEHSPSHPVSFNFANTIELRGYDLDPAEVQPGDIIQLTLYWQASTEMDEDYTVFTHLIRTEGRIWAQKDDQPRGGNYPTSFWEPGQVVKDRYEMTLSSDTPAGEYQIEVGLYLASTGDRLPVLDDAGQVRDNRVLLGTMRVTE
jgi:hypothetical protein